MGPCPRAQVGVKLYTLEDATFGYWLQPWDVRHVNHTRFRLVSRLMSPRVEPLCMRATTLWQRPRSPYVIVNPIQIEHTDKR